MKNMYVATILMILVIPCLTFSKSKYEKTICEDTKYIEIKKKDIKEMDEKEYNYFMEKDKACDNLRIAIDSNKKTSLGIKFLVITTGLISAIMLYLLVAQLGSS